MKLFSGIAALWIILVGCSDLDAPPDIKGLVVEDEAITSRTWKIEYFGNGPTASVGFRDAFIAFNDDNTFDIINNENKIYSGEWALSNSKDFLVIQSDGKIPSPYNELENEWIFTFVDTNEIMLRERDDQGSEEIRLNKPDNAEIPRVCDDIVNLLGTKTWYIERFLAANIDRTEEFKHHKFLFTSSAEVVVESTAERIVGNWDAGIRCDKISFDFGSVSNLNEFIGLWEISYISNNEIKLTKNEDGNLWEIRFSLRQTLMEDFCEKVESTVIAGNWNVDLLIIGNEDLSPTIQEFKVKFSPEGNLVVFNTDREIPGNWSLSNTCEIMAVRIEEASFSNLLSEDWQVLVVTDTLMKFVSEKDNLKKEISFSREPTTLPDDSCSYLHQSVEKQLLWVVEKYIVNDAQQTAAFEGVSFQFLSENRFFTKINNEVYESSWEIDDECKKLSTDGGQSEIAELISYSWYITKISLEKMILVYEDNERNIEMQLISKK